MDNDQEFILPFSEKNLLPKNKLDRGLFVFISVVIPSLTLWELWVLLDKYPELNVLFYTHLISLCFFIINVIGNLFYLQRVDSSGKRKKNVLFTSDQNWKYCHFCQINSPPRSYHCPICDECILKRDQHCMFAGCCVGFYNHRYYLMAVVYVMISSLYVSILQWPHVIESVGGYHWLTLICIIHQFRRILHRVKIWSTRMERGARLKNVLDEYLNENKYDLHRHPVKQRRCHHALYRSPRHRRNTIQEEVNSG
ncbi:hypothetical protein CDAR_303101 [Caerostris darwini]|uniref:Palmitoyltransferase n=1 Tax=Caerostris darwini TaxID=1538125 RepID=A0AAV4V547_9ARAC|nr:hypothetical protein CDAR_303101 [Caerostris darwini]